MEQYLSDHYAACDIDLDVLTQKWSTF